MGALDHAAVLARGLAPGSPRHRVYEAVVAWRRGDRAAALAELRRLFAENPGSSDVPVLPPSFLLGEIAVEAGEDGTAVEALKRFQGLHAHNPYWGWAYPRSVLLLATAETRLGRRDDARRRLAAQLDLWKDADPGLPLLAAMKDLCERLGCRAGAMVAGASAEIVGRCGDFGYNLGILVQVWNDIFGLAGVQGKNDAERRRALPVLAAQAVDQGLERTEYRPESVGAQAGQVYTVLQLGFLYQRAAEALARCPAAGSLLRFLNEYDPGRLVEMMGQPRPEHEGDHGQQAA
jgi:hypothetical protein